MTEQEAKTKWCFKYQVATSGGDSSTFETDNRPLEHEARDDGKWHPTGLIHPAARCIGSACMAWRVRETGDWADVFKAAIVSGQWIEAIKVHRNATGFPLKDSKEFVDAIRGGTKAMPERELSGFCGLAGRP